MQDVYGDLRLIIRHGPAISSVKRAGKYSIEQFKKSRLLLLEASGSLNPWILIMHPVNRPAAKRQTCSRKKSK
jgi:hypothetical protein